MIGQLATEYGFYGESAHYDESGESLKIIDSQEGFELNILSSDSQGSSAIWVARRIPDDEVTVTANLFSIREIDLSNH